MSEQLDISKLKISDLPRSMRHLSKIDALLEAIDIAYFLKEATEAIGLEEEGPSKEFYRGCSLVFNHMIDKMEIGAGDLKFPMHSVANGPTLTELLEAGQKVLQEKEGK